MSTTESGDGWAVVMAVYGMIDDNPKFPERCQITEFSSRKSTSRAAHVNCFSWLVVAGLSYSYIALLQLDVYF